MSVSVGSVLLCFMRQASSRHFKTYLKKRHGTSGKMEEKKRRASLSSLVSFIFFSFLMHLFRVSSLFDKWMLRIGKRALVSYVSVIFFHHLDWHLWLRRLVQQQFRLQAWLPCWLCYSLLISPPVMLLFFGQWTGSCKTRDISVY